MSALVKARPVALTLHNDGNGERAFMLGILKREGHRRAEATEHACHLALMAYEEGADRAIGRLLVPLVLNGMHWRERRKLLPDYCELRSFLIGELDAHELIACRVAFARVEMRNRAFRGSRFGDDCGGERGWL